jgi:hypothetical protein
MSTQRSAGNVSRDQRRILLCANDKVAHSTCPVRAVKRCRLPSRRIDNIRLFLYSFSLVRFGPIAMAEVKMLKWISLLGAAPDFGREHGQKNTWATASKEAVP